MSHPHATPNEHIESVQPASACVGYRNKADVMRIDIGIIDRGDSNRNLKPMNLLISELRPHNGKPTFWEDM
jgi:hypothetical protein